MLFRSLGLERRALLAAPDLDTFVNARAQDTNLSGPLLAYAILRGGSAKWIPDGVPALGINFTAGLTFLVKCQFLSRLVDSKWPRSAGRGAQLTARRRATSNCISSCSTGRIGNSSRATRLPSP